jgi:hypothetical protein
VSDEVEIDVPLNEREVPMLTNELEKHLEGLKDSELLRYASKYLKLAYLEMENPDGSAEDTQEVLDYVYMECTNRGKEWIFDKAQESCLRQLNETTEKSRGRKKVKVEITDEADIDTEISDIDSP